MTRETRWLVGLINNDMGIMSLNLTGNQHETGIHLHTQVGSIILVLWENIYQQNRIHVYVFLVSVFVVNEMRMYRIGLIELSTFIILLNEVLLNIRGNLYTGIWYPPPHTASSSATLYVYFRTFMAIKQLDNAIWFAQWSSGDFLVSYEGILTYIMEIFIHFDVFCVLVALVLRRWTTTLDHNV